jgi:hypothetical protein
MARNVRAPALATRTARLRLPYQNKPHFVTIAKGLALGYRRLKSGPGPWVIRSTTAGVHWTKAFATADDYEDANEANNVLDFHTAQRKAREVARGGNGEADSSAIVTVAGAIDAYELDLKARNANPYNATYARRHLSAVLLSKPVGALGTRELRLFRDSLLEGRAPASVNRIVCVLAAALSLAASTDQRINNKSAWVIGLQKLPGAGRPRNVVLTEDQIRAVVAAAYALNHAWGLLVETAAVTGSRYGQIAHITVAGLKADRLVVPSSRKGRGVKQIQERPVPIPAGLAAKLACAAEGRAADEPLLRNCWSRRWNPGEQDYGFKQVAERAGLDPKIVTMTALRHTSITRQLLANIPVRVVADQHDTSVKMIEQTYSHLISHHADAIARAAMLDLDVPADEVVVPLRKAAAR